ncbi:hypothetical protein ACHAXH_008033 [Discostella pseudostelligera]
MNNNRPPNRRAATPLPPAAAAMLPTVDATPRGYVIDVRIFLAVMTTTMALAFTAGVMFGPTNPALINPILSFLRVPLPEYYLDHSNMIMPNAGMKAIGVGSRINNKQQRGGSGSTTSDINAPARKLAEGFDSVNQSLGGSSGSDGSATSKKAKEVIVSPDGTILMTSDMYDAHGEVIIKQPKRTPTDHIATLGYKIKETHVNIVPPVLEGDASGGPIVYETNATNQQKGADEKDKPLLRDQNNPSGQHLLVDIKNLDAGFLNSESRLADAMQETVKAGGLTMLSYHCHSLHPAGVSCVGVLLESHISFHTWPDEGVITLDLFTTSERPLLPLLPTIEALFGIPRINAETGEKETPVTLWSHELRGFRTEDARKAHYLDGQSDLANLVTSPLEVVYKKQIVTMQTPYRRIEIWDTIERDETPSYEDGQRLGLKPGDPRWLSNEYVSPTRLFFLDGALQTNIDHERELHETLVHPAMFAHPSPKNVAIIGGGGGATLREVLRHKSVKKVTMVEIDEKVVQVSKEHMPVLSNCSEIVGSVPSCFDDARVNLIFADAFQYFVDNGFKDEFDVLIIDAMDPEEHDEYTNFGVINALVNSLSPNGVMAVHIGIAPSILDPRADKGVNPKRELLINNLEAAPGVRSIHIYEEGHLGYYEPRSFLVACRDVSCRKHWYAETDEIDYQIYERIGDMKSGEPSLVHYDGATQRSFHAPPRAWENIYCLREPTPFECDYRGLDVDKQLFDFVPDDEEASAFEIRPTKVESEDGKEKDGAAVFAKVDIPAGSFIMPTHLAASFEVSDDSMKNIRGRPTEEVEGLGKAVVIEDFIDYITTYGHSSLQAGSGKNFVEIGGSFAMRTSDDANEANVRRWLPPHPAHPGGGRPKYSPVYDRHRHSFDVFLVASRDIKAGEEIVKPSGLWNA